MPVLLFIPLVILLLYVCLILILSFGLHQLSPPSFQLPHHPSPVTVIVPFRDERDHLPLLLHDLEGQSYSMAHMEVIFVDDHSSDGSGELIRELIKNHSRFVCLELSGERQGKKEALALGVQHASGEWIIQADADCRLGANFVAAHISCLQETGADLVAGMVTTGEGKRGLLEILERLDLLSLVGASAGSFYLGRPLMCSGANLAYSRKLFLETRPFDPGPGTASGDDMFLMVGARKLGKKLVYLTSGEALVRTGSISDLRSLVMQRIRWGAKTPRYRMTDIQAAAVCTALANLCILVLPWLLLLELELWVWLVPAFIVRSLADFLLLFRITGYTGQRRDLRMFLPVMLLYYPYQAIVLAGSLFWRVTWKGPRKK